MADEFQAQPIFAALRKHEVDFVLIGGLAGMAHGSSFPSYDVDVAYDRDRENLERLVNALRELKATLRGAPPGLPFQLEVKTLENGANFTFTTPFGSLDILADAAGSPRYKSLRDLAIEVEIEGEAVRVASLDHLIAMKEAAGRTKDKLMAAEYRVLSDEIRARHDD